MFKLNNYTSICYHLINPFNVLFNDKEEKTVTLKEKVQNLVLPILVGSIATYFLGVAVGVATTGIIFYSLATYYKWKTINRLKNEAEEEELRRGERSVIQTPVEPMVITPILVAPISDEPLPVEPGAPIEPKEAVNEQLKMCFSKEVVKRLTPDEIKNLSDDEIGIIIDLYNDDAETLSQVQLNAMIRNTERNPFAFHEKQDRGGECGRHAINNAFGEIVEEGRGYREKVAAIFPEIHDGCPFLDLSDDDFFTEPRILQIILQRGKKQVHAKCSFIRDLPDYSISKSLALQNYLGEASWIIIGNSQSLKRFPTNSHATYPITSGHFVAARKNEKGEWWVIDSRNHAQISLPLTALNKDFQIFVPE